MKEVKDYILFSPLVSPEKTELKSSLNWQIYADKFLSLLKLARLLSVACNPRSLIHHCIIKHQKFLQHMSRFGGHCKYVFLTLVSYFSYFIAFSPVALGQAWHGVGNLMGIVLNL
jgi:hypothetical protein